MVDMAMKHGRKIRFLVSSSVSSAAISPVESRRARNLVVAAPME
jgi:hypothetical protein